MRRLLATAVLAFTALTPLPASADEAEPVPVGRMMLVLDASGSMAEPAAGGQAKIDAAKSALTTVVDSLPDEQPVGLRVYGATVFSAAEPGACTDSQKVVDVGTDNRDDLTAAIGDYAPFGETPIGYALQEAGKDLGSEGQRSIVLVSDGEPTCDPDPCVVAEQLSADGIDLRIDVVGLNVSGAARDALVCIADAGNGTYYDADDAAGLVDSLTVAQTRASRPFDLTGEPVTGTADLADAPELEAPGQYLDTIAPSGALHYRVPRAVQGSTIHVGVAFQGTAGTTGESVTLTLAPGSDPDGVSCRSEAAYGVGLGARSPLFYGGVHSWKSDPDAACNTDDELIVTIDQGRGADLGGRPIEIAVYEEPPLDDPSGRDLPPIGDEPEWETVEPSSTVIEDVVPGTSLANAPVVKDGTYSLDINAGETQVLAVPLDWGQTVQAQVDAVLTDPTAQAAAVGSELSVEVIGPLRQDGEVSLYGSEPADWTTGALANMNGGDPYRVGALTFPVTYLNRADNSGPVQAFSTAGLRYISVSLEVRGDEANQPYTLTIRTNGEAGDGEPEYDTADLPAPEADSPLVTSPVTSTDADSPSEARTEESGDSDSGFPWLPVGLGVAGVLFLGGAAALVLMSRRNRVSADR